MDVKETQNLILRARTLHQQKKFQQALPLYEKILKVHPYQHETLHLMGLLYHDLKNLPKALEYLNRALVITPNLPQLHHNIGLVHKDMGNFEKAISFYQYALRLNPKYYKAMHKLANVYAYLEQTDLAVNFYEKAMALQPDYADGWEDFANFSKAQKKIKYAAYCFENALKYSPDSINANYGLASILLETNKQELAITYLKKAYKLDPSQGSVLANLHRAYGETCNWQHYQSLVDKLEQMLSSPNNASFPDPFSPLAYNWSSELFAHITRQTSKLYSYKMNTLAKKLNFQFKKQPKEKLRIGYVSCAFNNHPTMHLAYNLFAYHDRSKFEIFCFAHGRDDKSIYRERARNTCDQFIDVGFKPASEIAPIIYNNQIDIFVDLDGHIRESLLNIAALRPAPIQMHYLGYPGTINADFIDYLVVDKIVMTDQIRPFYREKLVYMPNCYQVTNETQPISSNPMTRSQYQLPENSFVFCCFNNSYKIEPNVFDIWMRILAKIPNSVLWLLAPLPIVVTNLKNEAKKRGIDPERLVFATRENKDVHLARHQFADLFLDTLYYNAHTTATDSLWAGLPVLTCQGVNFASRVGSSILRAANLPELITTNIKDYEERAIYLATNPQELKKIREKLQMNRLNIPLFNTKMFVKNLEQGYLKIWDNYLNKETFEDIYID